MNRLRIFISLMTISVFLFLFATPSLAVVVKTAGELEVALDNEPLFGSEIIWAPSDSHSANFVVHNKSGGNKVVQVEALNTSQTGDLAEKMYLKFSENETGLYGKDDDKTLKEFWDAGEVELSWVDAGKEKTYTMTVAMDSTTGNEYQGKEVSFDIGVGFKGLEEPSVVIGTNVGSSPGAPAVAPGFLPGVLGEATLSAELEGELDSALATETGEVAGAAITPRDWRIWILIGLGTIGGIIIIYFRFFKRR